MGKESKRMEKRMQKILTLGWIVLLSLFSVSCSTMLADFGLADDPQAKLADCEDDADCDAEETSYDDRFAREETSEADDGFERDNGSTRNRVRAAIEANDVIPGMTRSEVVQSWGEPKVREFAGSGDSGHERWIYGTRRSQRGETFLIFENGRVVGWHR